MLPYRLYAQGYQYRRPSRPWYCWTSHLVIAIGVDAGAVCALAARGAAASARLNAAAILRLFILRFLLGRRSGAFGNHDALFYRGFQRNSRDFERSALKIVSGWLGILTSCSRVDAGHEPAPATAHTELSVFRVSIGTLSSGS